MYPIKVSLSCSPDQQTRRIGQRTISVDLRQRCRHFAARLVQVILGRLVNAITGNYQTFRLSENRMNLQNITEIIVNESLYLSFIEYHDTSLVVTIRMQHAGSSRLNDNAFGTGIVFSTRPVTLFLGLGNEIVHTIDFQCILIAEITAHIEIVQGVRTSIISEITEMDSISDIADMITRTVTPVNYQICCIVRSIDERFVSGS